MKDINKVILVGRLGGDPILRKTKNGISVGQLSVATARRFSRDAVGKEGESNWVEETQWHRVVVWGKQGENCAQYLHKGSAIYVEGFLRSRQYEDKSGQQKTTVEIHAENVSFLGGRKIPTTSEISYSATQEISAVPENELVN